MVFSEVGLKSVWFWKQIFVLCLSVLSNSKRYCKKIFCVTKVVCVCLCVCMITACCLGWVPPTGEVSPVLKGRQGQLFKHQKKWTVSIRQAMCLSPVIIAATRLALHTVLLHAGSYLNATTALSGHILHLLQVRSQAPAAESASSAPGSDRQVGSPSANAWPLRTAKPWRATSR